MTTQIILSQQGRYLEGDTDTPISLFLRNPQGILLESAEVDGRWGKYSILATGCLLSVNCRAGQLHLEIKDERLSSLSAFEGMPFLEGLRAVLKAITIQPDPKFANQPPITRGLYGYLGYGIAGLTLKRLAKVISAEEAEGCLILPSRVVIFDHIYNRVSELILTDTHEKPAPALEAETFKVGSTTESVTQEQYMAQVENIKEQLRQGEAIQVVLSTHFETSFKGEPFALYRRLRRINPSPYLFYMDFPDITLMGSSPELLIRCAANQLQLSPIAGTRKRGKTEEEDSMLATELLQDPKERAEHLMLVDLGRNDLGRLARSGTVNVERLMEVERFSHVMHLTSRVTAQLNPGLDAVDVIAATFPAGTVSGAPKVRAMEIIAETEKRPRGPYAGSIGWIGLDKDAVNLDMGITIRSLWIKDGKLHWQAGAGIVYDSVPASEYAECQNKAAIMKLVIGG
ncbi:MAG: anthranilate synthase component I family protein [bacterium]